MTSFRTLLTLSPANISAAYFAFGVVWIPSTDLLLVHLFGPQHAPTLVGVFKGWVFIGLSTILIYSVSRLHRRQMETIQETLETANQQLQVLHRVFRHNIRNDLNVIHGYAEIASERTTERTAQLHLATVRQTAERIIDVSEKLKVIERVDPTRSTDGTVDLVPIVEDELERTRSTAPEVSITADLPEQAWIEADDSIRYAIREVLENAVEHNDDEPGLSVTVDRTNGDVRLQVADDGPGIPPDELQSLQTGEETALVHASSVGLWLVTWMCRLHDGYVQFETESAGGTTVSFHFQAGSQAALMETQSQVTRRLESIAN